MLDRGLDLHEPPEQDAQRLDPIALELLDDEDLLRVGVFRDQVFPRHVGEHVLLHPAEEGADLLGHERPRQVGLVDDHLELLEREVKGLDLVEERVGGREVRALRQADPIDQIGQVEGEDLHREERIHVQEKVVGLGQRAQGLHDDVGGELLELLARRGQRQEPHAPLRDRDAALEQAPQAPGRVLAHELGHARQRGRVEVAQRVAQVVAAQGVHVHDDDLPVLAAGPSEGQVQAGRALSHALLRAREDDDPARLLDGGRKSRIAAETWLGH